MAQSRTTLDPAEAILAALDQHGQSTAADIATAAGVAYSTTTRNLRELAAAGRVEKVADGKQTQWRLPTTASPRAASEVSADFGPETTTEAGTEAGTEPGIPASGPSLVDRSPGAAGPDETGQTGEMDADAATLADTTITGPSDRPADTADPTDHDADSAETDGSGPHANIQDNGASDNGDQDSGTGDDVGSPEVRAEDGAAAGRPVGDVADETAADTNSDAAGPDGADAPDGAGTDAIPAAVTPAKAGGAAKPRRASGSLDGAVLDILEAHPDRAFKVSELCKLIDAANAGQDVSKASPGAVVLAGQRLVTKGKAILAVEKPVTFQLIPADTAAADTCLPASTSGR